MAVVVTPSASTPAAIRTREAAATSTGCRPSASRPAPGAATSEPSENAMNVKAATKPPKPRVVAISV